MRVPFYYMDLIPMNRVKQIFTVKDLEGTGLSVYIQLKDEFHIGQLESRADRALIQALGYQLPQEHYTPKYKTQEEKTHPEPDYRTTLYWNPNLQITEDTQKLTFYTNDTQSSYTVILEGQTSCGEFLHKEWTFNERNHIHKL